MRRDTFLFFEYFYFSISFFVVEWPICINVCREHSMSGETQPDTTVSFWFHYFRWPRTQPPSVPSVESKPRRTYRDALLTNLPVATEHDALLHETYLFV